MDSPRPSGPPDQAHLLRLLVFLVLATLAAEVVIMYALESLFPYRHWIKIILDVGLLCFVLTPLIYFRVILPYARALKEKEKDHQALEAARRLLESDVRDRNEKLARFEAENQSVLEASADGILRVDTRGVIKTANRSIHRLLRYNPGELTGQSIYEIVPPDRFDVLVQGYIASLGEWAGDDPWEERVTARLTRKDGGGTDTELSISECVLGGEVNYVLVLRDITETLKARHALERSEERYRLIVERGLLIAWEAELPTFRFTYVSHQAEDLLGYTVEEWKKPGFWADHIYEADREYAVRYCTEATEAGKDHIFDYRMTARNGDILWFRDFVTVEKDTDGKPVNIHGFLMNITEIKRAEEVNTRLGRMLDSSVNEILVFNAGTGRFTQANLGALRNLGYTLDELKERPAGEVITGIAPEVLRGHQQELRSGKKKHVRFNAEMKRKDGTVYPVELSLQYYGSEAPPLFVAVGQDITERIENEKALLQAKEEAEEATRLKDKFVSLVSHDLKNPLSSLTGFLKLAESRARGDEELIEILDHAIISSENMMGLIEELLSVSRLRTGQILPHKKFFNTHYLTLRSIHALLPLAKKKGVTVENALPEDYILHGDEHLIGNVVQNLVSNAIKFCTQGDRITIARNERGGLGIEVRDTGKGIAAERLPDLFKYEVKTSTVGTGGEIGTGLGLPLCRDIMEAHGGSLEVESEPGRGSVFRALLPSRQASVLLVDDEKAARELMAVYLHEFDVEILEAEDGRQALELLQEHEVDVVVADLFMPKVDGFTMLEKMKENPATADIPVIIITADGKVETRSKAVAMGAVDFLAKPVEQEDFVPRLRRFIG